MDQQNRDMHQSLKDLKNLKDREIVNIIAEKDEEIQHLKRQLDQTNQLKRDQAPERAVTQTLQTPSGTKPIGNTPAEIVAMGSIAKKLNLDADLFVAEEVAKFLRRLYINEQPSELTENAQQFLASREDKIGIINQSGYVSFGYLHVIFWDAVWVSRT